MEKPIHVRNLIDVAVREGHIRTENYSHVEKYKPLTREGHHVKRCLIQAMDMSSVKASKRFVGAGLAYKSGENKEGERKEKEALEFELASEIRLRWVELHNRALKFRKYEGEKMEINTDEGLDELDFHKVLNQISADIETNGEKIKACLKHAGSALVRENFNAANAWLNAADEYVENGSMEEASRQENLARIMDPVAH
ncbi:MAG: hypothetical protein ACOCQD_03710 [archaeon]